jgi:predicted NBD/HSP70 family sugar kinase
VELARAGRRQGLHFNPAPTGQLLFDRGIPLWAGASMGRLFTHLGGASIQRSKLDLPALRTARRLLLEGPHPFALAPEGATNGHIERLSPLEPRELCRRAEAGEAEALAVWERYGRWLGIGLSSLIYVLTPERVLLGGGLSAGFPHFLPAVWREIEARVLPPSREGLVIQRCALLLSRCAAAANVDLLPWHVPGLQLGGRRGRRGLACW